MATTSCSRWEELPFREIWCADFEFYPGTGLANRSRDGDLSTVLCLVAKEMRSGRVVRLWQDELGPFPPYRLDSDSLFIAYMNSAEFGCHIALGWGQPACSIDAYVEFRHLTNNGAIKAADRDKGFYALPGYAPDPDWTKVPPFEELVAIAFGEHGVITSESHPIYRELFGAADEDHTEDDDGDDLL